MSQNPFDLHAERLSTTDDEGHRVFLYPEDIKGLWRKRRTIFYWALVISAIIIPWLHVNNQQLVRIDLPNREFHFFGIHLWAHDIPYMFLILVFFVFLMALITAIWGRVWCGWACPQTVFIDTLYRGVEKLIEGPARMRANLDKAPWSFEKFLKRFLKWSLFLIISAILAHSAIGYFVGTKNLIHIVTQSPSANWTAFLGTIFFTLLFLFDFGWFREQFCLIACPYGRFQSVLMDADSLTVTYDVTRGEPRKGVAPTKEDEGDCVNCYACVRACPTGIDIRRGSQLECIACTNCIDACDMVMEKVKKPTGLIRYSSENEMNGKITSFIRPRTLIYFSILFIITVVSLFLFYGKDNLRVLFVRGSNSPYQLVEIAHQPEIVVNHYKADLFFEGQGDLHLSFKVDNEYLTMGLQVVTPMNPLTVIASRKKTANIFFKFPPEFLINGIRTINVFIYDQDKLLDTKEITLVGPINKTR